MKELTVGVRIITPRVPNYLQSSSGRVDVKDVTDVELKRIGEAWTEQLLENARQRRGVKP